MGLIATFLVAFAGALSYHRLKRRTWGLAAHRAAVFGFATTLLLLLGVLVADGFGLLPEFSAQNG